MSFPSITGAPGGRLGEALESVLRGISAAGGSRKYPLPWLWTIMHLETLQCGGYVALKHHRFSVEAALQPKGYAAIGLHAPKEVSQ